MTDAGAGIPTPPRSGPTSRGGRRRGGLASGPQHYLDGSQRGHSFRAGRGERGTPGRGRANPSHKGFMPDPQLRISNSGPRDDGLGRVIEGKKPNGRRKTNDDLAGQRAVGDQNQSVEEGELCFICASTIEHLSIAPCNHQTCHICALRLRALYKRRDCAYCKTEAPYVILTDDATRRYEEFATTDFIRCDENLGIKYEKEVILEDTVLLLRYNCPDRDCDVACLGWPHLHRHVKQRHGKLMCDLCTRNKKVFTHEHELFTYGELRRHEKSGDDYPGAIDQSGFKGHPGCGFCRERFYGDDELYQHCREKHERCHICDRRNPGSQVQYYLNYQMLEKHFEEVHFVCLDAECQANKTNVFESEMDLKAHQLSSHPNGLSKDARRDARLVNISSFDYRTPYQPHRRGERDQRGYGRGRDPNAEALPVSSAQPLRRDELAYQRQMAISTAQPQLVPRNHAASPVPATVSHSIQTSTSVPNLDTLSLDPSSNLRSDQNLTPQEQARQIRHSSVLQRASTLLGADGSKLSMFRNHVSSYRSSTFGATELIDSFFSLFDVPSVELGKLVRELADIYEDEDKRQDLLKAWNDWLSINADYPSLPGPNGVLPGINGGGGGSDARPSGRRVLRLKSSTAKSSRSAVSRQGARENALSNNASSTSNPFPALGGASSLANDQKRAAWTGVPASSSVRASPADAGPSSRPPPTMSTKANQEMFPALPIGKKPDTLMAGLTRGTVRWDDSKSGNTLPSNPWVSGVNGPTGGASNQSAADDRAEVGSDSVNHFPNVGVGKRGKKGKQVLYKFG